MKAVPTFGFADEPQYRSPASREWVAHALRAYRARCNAGRYSLTRKAPGLYHVTTRGSAALAIITTR